MSDIRRNIEKLQPALHFVHWNQQGWKTGLCSVPPIGQVSSFLKVHTRYSVPPVEEVYLFVFVCFVCFVGLFVLFSVLCFRVHARCSVPPLEEVYLFVFVCFVCLCFLKVHMQAYIPPMDDWLCILIIKETFVESCVMDSLPQPYSLLTLANNTCFRHTLTDIRERFSKLYRRKVSAW